MELTISETVRRKIKLDEKEMAKVALEYIKQEFGIDPHMWIDPENEKLMEEVEYVTSHKWSCKEEVRDASEFDRKVLDVASAIHRRLYDGH